MSQVDDLQQKLNAVLSAVKAAADLLRQADRYSTTYCEGDCCPEVVISADGDDVSAAVVDKALRLLAEVTQQSCGCDPSDHSLPSASDPDTVCAGCGHVVG